MKVLVVAISIQVQRPADGDNKLSAGRKEAHVETLNKMKDRVIYLLEEYPELRDDDWMLIGAVYSEYYDITDGDSFLEVMFNHEVLGLPSFETIRRTRQKVQEERMDLESSRHKKRERQMAFDAYFKFAKEA